MEPLQKAQWQSFVNAMRTGRASPHRAIDAFNLSQARRFCRAAVAYNK